MAESRFALQNPNHQRPLHNVDQQDDPLVSPPSSLQPNTPSPANQTAGSSPQNSSVNGSSSFSFTGDSIVRRVAGSPVNGNSEPQPLAPPKPDPSEAWIGKPRYSTVSSANGPHRVEPSAPATTRSEAGSTDSTFGGPLRKLFHGKSLKKGISNTDLRSHNGLGDQAASSIAAAAANPSLAAKRTSLLHSASNQGGPKAQAVGALPQAPDRDAKRAWQTAQLQSHGSPSRPPPPPNSGKSFLGLKRLFQSRSTKQRKEIEEDRTRRRRSFVELDPPTPVDQLPPKEGHPRNWNPRSLRGPPSSVASSAAGGQSNESLHDRGNFLSHSRDTTGSSWQSRDRSQSRPNGTNGSTSDAPAQQRDTEPTPAGAVANDYFSQNPNRSRAQSSVESFDSFGNNSTEDNDSSAGNGQNIRAKTSSSSLSSLDRRGPRQGRQTGLSRHPTLETVEASPLLEDPPQSPEQVLSAHQRHRDSLRTVNGLDSRAVSEAQPEPLDSEMPFKNGSSTDGDRSGWRMPSFSRKSSRKQDEEWDDYQRGVSSGAPSQSGTLSGQATPGSIGPRPSKENDSKLRNLLGLDAQSGGGPSRERKKEVLDDLRETGYLPRRQPSASSSSSMRRRNSAGKMEMLMSDSHSGGDMSRHQSQDLLRSPSSRSGGGRSLPAASLTVASPSQGSNASLRDISMQDADCPVCLEPLSYRLNGEKPHVVPNCGHALHNACFTAVYGQPEAVIASQTGGDGRNGPPGMCGVCRRAIVLGGEVEGSRTSKAAGMMGLGGTTGPQSRSRRASDAKSETPADDSVDPGNRRQPSSSVAMASGQQLATRSASQDGSGSYRQHEETTSAASVSAPSQAARQAMVHPLIKVRPEYTTIYRKDPTGQNGKQNIVCVVSITVPSRRRPLSDEEEEAKYPLPHWHGLQTIEDQDDGHQGDVDGDDGQSQVASSIAPRSEAAQSQLYGNGSSDLQTFDGDGVSAPKQNGGHDDARSNADGDEEGFSFSTTPAGKEAEERAAAVCFDLSSRILDWKGQSIERFGKLMLYDYIGVKQDKAVVRNFWVYLFHGALLCVTEERKKDRGGISSRLNKGNNGPVGHEVAPATPTSTNRNKPALKLKGRIWLRHISGCEEGKASGHYTLTVKLDDDSVDYFALVFNNRQTLELWKSKVVELIEVHRVKGAPPVPPPAPSSVASSAITVTSTRQGLRELPSYRAMTEAPSQELPSRPSEGSTSNHPRQSVGGVSTMSGKAGSSSSVTSPSVAIQKNQQPRAVSQYMSAPAASNPQQWSGSGGLDPSLPPPPMLPHTPLDLVLMVSVPVVTAPQTAGVSSSAALKLRLIRSTLDFVTQHLGPRDRIALVAYNAGQAGEVRRTALLNMSRERSQAKLVEFIEGIGKAWGEGEEDVFRVDSNKLGGASDRTDTVTALNVGLDVVLGRKNKNPCTGMILINDTSDGPLRNQMDLVMARAEAANVPIHCFGFGKSNNPSSLWLISNHTHGSYTFVREWYQLRECIAGCIGSLMSIALDQVKLHISVPGDNHFKVRKVAGQPGAIVSSTGKTIDIEVGELRFGETRELFIELELDFNGLVPFIAQLHQDGRVGVKRVQNAPAIEAGSATDDFMQRLGLTDLSLTSEGNNGSQDNYNTDGGMDSFIEEVAVFEVDAGYRDVNVGSTLRRLNNPTVLTMEVDASSPEPGPDGQPRAHVQGVPADAVVTRRRIEILVSDMITRSLLLVSRKNHSQALRIVKETQKIVETVLRSLSSQEDATSRDAMGTNRDASRQSLGGMSSLYSTSSGGNRPLPRSAPARQKALLQRSALASLSAIIDDLELMADGLLDSTSAGANTTNQFDRDGRNTAAQQAMILRDQIAWSTRTMTETLRFNSDNGAAFAALAFAASRSAGM